MYQSHADSTNIIRQTSSAPQTLISSSDHFRSMTTDWSPIDRYLRKRFRALSSQRPLNLSPTDWFQRDSCRDSWVSWYVPGITFSRFVTKISLCYRGLGGGRRGRPDLNPGRWLCNLKRPSPPFVLKCTWTWWGEGKDALLLSAADVWPYGRRIRVTRAAASGGDGGRILPRLLWSARDRARDRASRRAAGSDAFDRCRSPTFRATADGRAGVEGTDCSLALLCSIRFVQRSPNFFDGWPVRITERMTISLFNASITRQNRRTG